MKNKFKYLVSYSLKKKINTKWFKVVNVLLCILLVFLFNMDYVIEFFGGDFNQKETIYVVDEMNRFEAFKNYFHTLTKQLDLDDYEIILDNEAFDNPEQIDEQIVVVLSSSDTEFLTSEIISYDGINASTYELIIGSLNSLKSEIVYESSGLSKEEIARLTSPVSVKETVLNEEAKDTQTKETLSTIVTTVVIVPFFLLIVTMVQMLGAEINDEKTSRGMEIIISSVPVKLHFLSKVLASLCYVLFQGCLLFLYAFLAVFIRTLLTSGSDAKEVGSALGSIMVLLKEAGIFSLLLQGGLVLLVLYVVSFIAYAITSATFASMTTNNEDFQQLQTPLMIIMMVGYYLAIMAVAFDGSVFINIIAYIPLFSVLLAPTLYLMGEMTLVSLIGTTLVTIVATYFLYHYGLRIYKEGILNYSSSKLWRKMFQSLKNKN